LRSGITTKKATVVIKLSAKICNNFHLFVLLVELIISISAVDSNRFAAQVKPLRSIAREKR